MYRIGFGTDIHRLEPGLPLILGGVRIESELGAVGHSDADALTHAITDAILGALALGDIGSHFPDSEVRWKGSNSLDFLRHAASMAREKGYSVSNIDSTLHLERPKLRPYIDAVRHNLATTLDIDISVVSVKAKTGEGIGEIGTLAAVKAEAAVLLSKMKTL